MASLDKVSVPRKVVLVGDAQAGKTCLRRAFAEQPFEAAYVPTLGVEYAKAPADLISVQELVRHKKDCEGQTID